MYLTLNESDQQDYFSLEPDLKEACSEMDEANPENIQNLYQAGLSFVYHNAAQIKEIARKVMLHD